MCPSLRSKISLFRIAWCKSETANSNFKLGLIFILLDLRLLELAQNLFAPFLAFFYFYVLLYNTVWTIKSCFLKCEENVHLLNGAHRRIFIKPQRVEKSSRWIIPQLPNCPSLLLKTLNFILLINQQSFTPNQPSFTPDPSFHIKF